MKTNLLFPGVDRMDIPLLMALASSHTPQIQRKYGISFLTWLIITFRLTKHALLNCTWYVNCLMQNTFYKFGGVKKFFCLRTSVFFLKGLLSQQRPNCSARHSEVAFTNHEAVCLRFPRSPPPFPSKAREDEHGAKASSHTVKFQKCKEFPILGSSHPESCSITMQLA